jgi:hypothetical protein
VSKFYMCFSWSILILFSLVIPLVVLAKDGDQLPKETINMVAHRHAAEINQCLKDPYKTQPNIAGTVTIGFEIQPTGLVSACSVKKSDLNNPTLEACVCSHVKTWVFPRAYGVTQVDEFPIHVNPKK